MAITKLDVLTGLKEIRICVAYKYKGKIIKDFPGESEILKSVKPVYITLKGWVEDITNIGKYGDLPVNTKKYLDKIRKLTGLNISILSFGPDRKQTIILDKKIWKQ